MYQLRTKTTHKNYAQKLRMTLYCFYCGVPNCTPWKHRCTACRIRGHEASTCHNPPKKERARRCTVCRIRGHDVSACFSLPKQFRYV